MTLQQSFFSGSWLLLDELSKHDQDKTDTKFKVRLDKGWFELERKSKFVQHLALWLIVMLAKLVGQCITNINLLTKVNSLHNLCAAQPLQQAKVLYWQHNQVQ